MSLKGSGTAANVLRGKANNLDYIQGDSAYEIAVKNGFEGTEEEWLESLKAADPIIPDMGDVGAIFINHPEFVDQMIQVAKSYYIKDAQYLKETGRHYFNYHQYNTCLNDTFGDQRTIPVVWPDTSKAAGNRRQYASPIAQHNFLDCSAYINLVLRGIPYEKSPYTLPAADRVNWDRFKVGANTEDYPWAMNPFDWHSSRTALNHYWEKANYTTKEYPSVFYPGETVTVHTTDPEEKYAYYDYNMPPRGAANLGKLLAGHGCNIVFNKDFSNVEPGDIILYSSGETENYKSGTHIAICGSKEPVKATDADYNRFKSYPYKHRIYDSTWHADYNTYGDNPDIPTFIRYITVEDADGNVVDVISERYMETANQPIVAVLRPDLANIYGRVKPIHEGGTGAATAENALKNLGKLSGTYTGNGNATARTIEVGGIGNAVLIWSIQGAALVTRTPTLVFSGLSGVTALGKSEATVTDGVITLATTNVHLNKSGTTYYYQVL